MQLVLGVGFALAILLGEAAPCTAYDRVTVESKTFARGQTSCTVGVFFENDVGLVALTVPLEIRSIDAGAYPTSGFWRSINDVSRFGASPLGVTDSFPPAVYAPLQLYAIPSSAPLCSGPASRTWQSSTANIDYISPDAILIIGISRGDEGLGEDIDMDPGRDPIATDSAGVWIGFDVSTVVGQFEIDTCCVRPAVHLAYIDRHGSLFSPPLFTKGIMTIGCDCPCQSDPNCDGMSTDAADVAETIDVAFRANPEVSDAVCPSPRTDVDCDAVTTVVDVVRVTMVTFRDADPETYYCDPCE
jgi:hypothetical protein